MQVLLLHCLQGSRLVFRSCGLVSLGKEIIPPKGVVHEVAEAPARRDLQVLRVMVPIYKVLVSEERWKSIKAHPVSMLESWKGSLMVGLKIVSPILRVPPKFS